MTTTRLDPGRVGQVTPPPAAPAARERRRGRRRHIAGNRRLVIGGALLTLMVVMTLLGRLLVPYGPNDTAVEVRLQAPGAAHLLGTDGFGRDVLARLTHALEISLGVALSVTLLSVVLALVLGLSCAYYRAVDRVVMRICDALLAIPDILLALAVVAALGPSVPNLVACLAIVAVPGMARTVRATALTVREATYVEAMRSLGASDLRIMVRHILPNAVGPLVVQASAVFSTAIIVEAALSFLGAGIPAPDASLGNMLSDATEFIYTAWWLTLFPGIALALTVLGANLLGDGLADATDPRGAGGTGRVGRLRQGIVGLGRPRSADWRTTDGRDER